MGLAVNCSSSFCTSAAEGTTAVGVPSGLPLCLAAIAATSTAGGIACSAVPALSVTMSFGCFTRIACGPVEMAHS